MPRNTNKKTSKRKGESSSQPTGGSSSQPEGYIPTFDPDYMSQNQTYWCAQQSPMSPMQQTPQQFQQFQSQSPQQFQQSPQFQQSQQPPQFQFQQFQPQLFPQFQPQHSPQFLPQHSPQFQPPLSQQFQSQQSPQFRPYDLRGDEEEVVPDTESEPEADHQDDHVYDNDDEDADEEADEGGSSRSGRAPRKNWNRVQEALLGKAWCDVSQDPVFGNDQTSNQFWIRVTKRFNTELGLGPDYRTHHQCNTKFNNMNRDIQKYNGLFTQYWNQPRSGENEQDVIERAEASFRGVYGKPWKYHHVWKIVRGVDKWQQLPLWDEVAKRGKRRANLSTAHLRSRQSEPLNVDLNEAAPSQPLPAGRDGRKKARSSGSSSARSSSARSEELQELRSNFSVLSTNLTQHMETNAMMKAYDLFTRDISHLEGEDYETALKIRQDLKKKFKF